MLEKYYESLKDQINYIHDKCVHLGGKIIIYEVFTLALILYSRLQLPFNTV